MPFTLSRIADILGLPAPVNNPDLLVSTLLTDSRSLLTPDSTLFFALRTPSGDGHAYIPELYTLGVRNFVVSSLPDEASSMTDANFLVVDSPLAALQSVAAAARGMLDATVIAVTGSRGKTTVKEWLYQLLSQRFIVGRSPRSFNSQIGVPLSLYAIEPSSRVAIIEAGVSRCGEMDTLRRIIDPDIVVFTNIGAPHSSGFDSISQKAAQKASLAARARHIVYCVDDPVITEAIPEGPQRFGWTLRQSPDATLDISVSSLPDGVSSRLDYSLDGSPSRFLTLPFTARQDIENACHCLAVMLLSGASPEEIAEAFSLLRPVRTRLEVIDAIGGSLIIRDRFTADLPSLALALDFMKRRAVPDLSLTLILGDLDHAHVDPASTYRRAISLARARGVSRIIGIGPDITAITAADSLPIESYPSVDDFLSSVTPEQFASSLILIKGSPQSPLAEVERLLEKRRNETVLEINLDAVVDNFNFFRSFLRPSTGIVCMIKASGYGAGSPALARTLQSQGASYLAVAVHDEGADLRQAGITMPIIVLNPAVDNLSSIFDNRLEPEIYSLPFLRSLIAEAARRGLRDYPVHIKIDSGMHRLGFLKETLPELIELLKSSNAVAPASIFSHLCCADDPADDDYTRMQFDYFDECCEMLLSAFPGRRILRHILNSTGIIRFPGRQYDMVRLGIGLYGVRTMHDGSQDALRPVSALRTSIISLKHWPEGTSIGYNRRTRLARPSVIATIPIGYADGINRHLGRGNARFNVDGHLCPTVGNICMDACMIDVTDVPGVHTGQRVEIFGDTISVETISDTLDTIPYEILTSISQRVKRIYYRE